MTKDCGFWNGSPPFSMDETTWQKEWLIEYRKKQNSVIWITCLLAIFSAQLPDLKQKKTKKNRRTSLQLMDSANDSDHTADFFCLMLIETVPIPHLFHDCVIKQIQALWRGGSGREHPHSTFYSSNCGWLNGYHTLVTANFHIEDCESHLLTVSVLRGRFRFFFNSGCVRYFSIVGLFQPIDGSQHAPRL